MVEFKKIEGVCPILATTFSENGEIDFESLENLIEFLIEKGVNGITLFGFAGEFYKLLDDEKERILKFAINIVKGRVPVIASIMQHSFESAVSVVRLYEKLGANGIMVAPPNIFPLAEKDYHDFYLEIDKQLNIPIIIQDAPRETKITLSSNFFINIFKKSRNISLIKIESYPPGLKITDIKKLSKGKINIFSGSAGIYLIDGLERGVDGTMPGSSLVDIYVKVFNSFKRGDIEKAYEIFNKYIPLLNFMHQSVEMIIKVEKTILKNRKVIKTNYCRYPSFYLDKIYMKQINKLYALIEDILN